MKYFYVPSSFSYFCVIRCKHLNKGGNMEAVITEDTIENGYSTDRES